MFAPRRPEYQNLWLKIQFEKGWVDSLPEKNDSEIDSTTVVREVLIFAKDIKQYLNNLEAILYHFDKQINNDDPQGIYVEFDAACTAGKVSKIYQQLNVILAANEKDNLEKLEMGPGAFQFGFTNDYKLKYIAFSEVPDCLCDADANINAYVLKKGLKQLISIPPFSSSTINALIHFLPDIERRYNKNFAADSSISGNLFDSHRSALSFIQSYVYPPKEAFLTGTPELSAAEETAIHMKGWADIARNPLWGDLASGAYISDPTKLLSPDIRNSIIASSNATSMYGGDDNVLTALMSDIESITSLYDKLLNKIPMADLVKFAASIIFKCLDQSEWKTEICKIILNTLPLAAIRSQLYPCLKQRGVEGEAAIAKLEEKISGRVGAVL